jgi:hypothetical protein
MPEVDRLPLEYPFRQSLGIYVERLGIFFRHLAIALGLSFVIFAVTHGLLHLIALWTLYPQVVSFGVGMVIAIVSFITFIRADSHEQWGAVHTSPLAFAFILLYAWLNKTSSLSTFVFTMLVPGVCVWIALFFAVLGLRKLIHMLVSKWRDR